MAKHRTRLQEGGARADPCLPSGFKAEGSPAGSGDWEACKAAARKLLPTERCTFSSCSLGNVFTPPVEGPLIGIDNFFWVRVYELARVMHRTPQTVAVDARPETTAAVDFLWGQWLLLLHPQFLNVLGRQGLAPAVALLTSPDPPPAPLRPRFHRPVFVAPERARASAQAGPGPGQRLRGGRQAVLRQGLGRHKEGVSEAQLSGV
jgi:hypothetical protein